MKSPALIPAMLILTGLLSGSCQKRPFARIEVHGRLINGQTSQPIQGQVSLWVGGEPPGSNGTVSYGETDIAADGTFDIKSKAQWSGNKYWLHIVGSGFNSDGDIEIAASKNKNTDLGNIKL